MSPAKRTAETTAALRESLVAHAQRIVAREGASALTMRALAAEAGCAVGLPYKVFVDRRDLIAELVHAEFIEMQAVFDELVARAGTGTIGGNLSWFADVLLTSPAVAVAQEVFADEQLTKIVTARIHETGAGPGSFETILSGYLAAEKRAGRVDPDVRRERLRVPPCRRPPQPGRVRRGLSPTHQTPTAAVADRRRRPSHPNPATRGP